MNLSPQPLWTERFPFRPEEARPVPLQVANHAEWQVGPPAMEVGDGFSGWSWQEPAMSKDSGGQQLYNEGYHFLLTCYNYLQL